MIENNLAGHTHTEPLTPAPFPLASHNGELESFFPALSPKSTVLLEYSCPALAQPFDPLHLRSTILGGSISRLLKHRGHNVVSFNYIGDWCSHFGFVWAAVKYLGLPTPTTTEEIVHLHAIGSISREKTLELPEGKIATINDERFRYFRSLIQGDLESLKFWTHCREIFLSSHLLIYESLGVDFDFHVGESSYRDEVEKLLFELNELGILRTNKTSQRINLGNELGDVEVVDKNKFKTALIRDVAVITKRLREFGPDFLFFILSDQLAVHFLHIRALLEILCVKGRERVIHVPFKDLETLDLESENLARFLLSRNDRTLDTQESKIIQGKQEEFSRFDLISAREINFSILASRRCSSAKLEKASMCHRYLNAISSLEKMLYSEGNPCVSVGKINVVMEHVNSLLTKAEHPLSIIIKQICAFDAVLHIAEKKAEPTEILDYIRTLTERLEEIIPSLKDRASIDLSDKDYFYVLTSMLHVMKVSLFILGAIKEPTSSIGPLT